MDKVIISILGLKSYMAVILSFYVLNTQNIQLNDLKLICYCKFIQNKTIFEV